MSPTLPLPTSARGEVVPSAVPATASAAVVVAPIDDAKDLPATPPQAAAVPPELTIALRVLAAIAVLGALVWMRDLLAPLAMAALLALMLWPAVAWGRRRRVPGIVSAALVVGGMVAVLWSMGLLMRGPISDFIDRWPQTRGDIERRVDAFRASVEPASAPLATAPVPTLRSRAKAVLPAASAVEPAAPRMSWWEPVQKLGQAIAERAQVAAATLFTLFIALFAFLAFGHRLVRAGRRSLAHGPRGRSVVAVLEASQAALQSYWFTVGAINVGVAVVVSATFYLIGLPNAMLWGAMAGMLNFIPVVGPLVFLALLGIVSYTSYETLGAIALPPLLYFAIHLVEGQVLTPTLLGRRLSLNPAVVLVSILFWTWAWGVLGTLLAVPLLLCLKMVCDHDPALARFGAMLE